MQYGGGVVTFILCLVVTWLIATQYGEYNGYREANTEHAANSYADKVQSACNGFTGPELERCRSEVQKSAEEAKRTQKDLQAQREVALYTQWLMWIGGAGILLTVVGLYYLAGNLHEMREGRRASEQALEIARNEQRAWIKMDIDHAMIDPQKAADVVLFDCNYTLKNVGKLPAAGVRVKCYVFESSFGFAANFSAPEFAERAKQLSTIRELKELANMIFPGDTTEFKSKHGVRDWERFQQFTSHKQHIFAAYVVIYRSYGSPTIHHTANVYEVLDHKTEDGKTIFLRCANNLR